MAVDRYAFQADWFDQNACMNRNFQLIYYPSDSSIELYDMKKKKVFLRRCKIETVSFDNLFIGSIITVHSRQFNITDFANEFTKKKLESEKEKTIAIIKPDAIPKCGAIMNLIYRNDFKIVNAKMIRLTRKAAQELYKEHMEQEFFEELVQFMSSSNIITLELMAVNAIDGWRKLLGPTDSTEARCSAPNSIRAMFGLDQRRNACHGSDSIASAQSEAEFFYGDGAKWTNTAQFIDSTCCIIKPSIIQAGKAGLIMMAIAEAGFHVTALQMFNLDRANAEEFYEIYKGVLNEYSDMVSELCSGPCLALEISGKGADTPTLFRDFVGPADPEIACTLRPRTLRALFGQDKIKNAVHCTDLPEDAELEVTYFFKILSN